MPEIPIPRDIPLPLPISQGALEVLLVFVFLAHILFVNLMVGGSLLTLALEVRGLRRPEWDRVARAVARTITVNKSLAVVLGVAPLLVINVLYTVWFYTSSALIGGAWIALVPLIIAAFGLAYAHKYSWDALAQHKGLHLALGAGAALLFLALPFVFLSNINLMLFPERWLEVRGFLSAVLLPNVLPRWLHFVLASLAITGVFLAGWFGRRGFDPDALAPLERGVVRRQMLSVALAATIAQAVAGPLVLFTLPSRGVGWSLLLAITVGLSFALFAAVLLWHETIAPARTGLGRRYWSIVALLAVTVTFMGFGRHLYRETSLAEHRAAVRQATEQYEAELLAAQMRAATGTRRVREEVAASPGERVFKSVCMSCHAQKTRLVGPPLTEIVKVYDGKPEQLVAWVRAPGRKRLDYPQMPAVKLSEDQYRAVAEYVLAQR